MKYGFVYIWFDKKRKMYYIGSHYGEINDGYICSSNRMRNAYKRRPTDFKRKILQSNIEKTVLLDEEQKWLSKIKRKEKYYNISFETKNPWWNIEPSKTTVSQKISKSLKGKKQPVEVIEKRKQTCRDKNIKFDWNKGKKYTEEEKITKYASRKGRTPWNKNIKQGPHKNPRKPYSEEAKKSFVGPRGPNAALKAWETKRKNNGNNFQKNSL